MWGVGEGGAPKSSNSAVSGGTSPSYWGKHQIPVAAPGLKCQSLWLPLDKCVQLSSAGRPRQLLQHNRDKCNTDLDLMDPKLCI